MRNASRSRRRHYFDWWRRTDRPIESIDRSRSEWGPSKTSWHASNGPPDPIFSEEQRHRRPARAARPAHIPNDAAFGAQDRTTDSSFQSQPNQPTAAQPSPFTTGPLWGARQTAAMMEVAATHTFAQGLDTKRHGRHDDEEQQALLLVSGCMLIDRSSSHSGRGLYRPLDSTQRATLL
jgi:hypothetical protein